MKLIVLFSTLTTLVSAIPTLSGKKLEESTLIPDKKTAKRNTESFNSEWKTPSMGFVSESIEHQIKKEALEQIQKIFIRLEKLRFKIASLNDPEWVRAISKEEERLAKLKEDIENDIMQEMGHHKMKSGWQSDMGDKKQENHMKKVENNLHVAASNQRAHVIKPKVDSGMHNSKNTMEGKRENNQPSAPQNNYSMWQEMDQSRNSQHESMRPKDKLHELHDTEHHQDIVSFMKASNEHNQRFHSTNQNIHHKSPVGSHGTMLQERYAKMANAEWGIQNRWQKRRSAGGAYGPSLGYDIPPPYSGSASSGSATTSGDSGSGAVVVFPNSKAGNCGIPLLLRCSPSVVSGILSKASSYSAPAYKANSEHTYEYFV